MALRSFFLTLILLTATGNPQAQATYAMEDLSAHVLNFAQNHYKELFGEEKFRENLQISVGNLDSRLKLASCDKELTLELHKAAQNSRNVTVKTSCPGSSMWSIYVPVTVDIFAEVIVADKSLQKGRVIVQEDFRFQRVKLSSVGHGYIEDSQRLLGMELRRPMKSGEVLRLSQLRRPDIVHRGQIVTLSTKSKFLSVETEGVALVDGHLGERIKVKNQRSQRVVMGEVIAPGRVVVAIR